MSVCRSSLCPVFSELLNRILDLDVQEYAPEEAKMVITVFQYASYFLSQGRYVHRPCLPLGGLSVWTIVCVCTS